jgi:Uncharacterised nucleotidyltransferase
MQPDSYAVRTLERRIARFGLPPLDPDPPPITIEDGEWHRLLPRLTFERLTGLAFAAAEANDLVVTGDSSGELMEHQMAAMHHALNLERALVKVAAEFDAAEVDFIVLKGSALAHSLYPYPAWRPFGDIDVLVRTIDWEGACDVLRECGFAPKYPEPRPGYRARFGHTACHANKDGLEFDLHRTLVGGPFGLWIDLDELFEQTTTFTLGGKTLRRFDDTAIFAHACIHASLGYRPPLLLPLRDVAQVVAFRGIDWGRMEDWANRWKLRAVVQHSLIAVADALGISLPPPAAHFLETGRAPRRERRALEAYTTGRRHRGGTALSSLWAIRGLRSKTAYVLALVLPSREFLEFREGQKGWQAYMSRWLKTLRSVTGR